MFPTPAFFSVWLPISDTREESLHQLGVGGEVYSNDNTFQSGNHCEIVSK